MSDDFYTQSRLARFTDELDNKTSNMESLEYFGTAGDVYVAVNGRRELLRTEIAPDTTADEDTLRRWRSEALAMALEEVDVAEQYIINFISEDLALGC